MDSHEVGLVEWTRVVVLADAAAPGGRHLAGVRLDGRGWLHPVSSVAAHDILAASTVCSGGRLPTCLDVVSIPVTGVVDADPERCLVDENLRWAHMGPLGMAEWPAVMRRVQTSTLATDEHDGSGIRRCIHTLVQPQDSVFHVRLARAPLVEVSFSLDEQHVRLPVWDVRLIQQLVAAGDGDYSGETLGLESGCTLLTVDLGVSHGTGPAVVGCFAVPFPHEPTRSRFAQLSLLPIADVAHEEGDAEEEAAFLQWAEEEALTQEALEAGEDAYETTFVGQDEYSDWDGCCPECGEFICAPFVAVIQDVWTCDMCGADVSSSGEVLLWDEGSEVDESDWDGFCPECDARICNLPRPTHRTSGCATRVMRA